MTPGSPPSPAVAAVICLALTLPLAALARAPIAASVVTLGVLATISALVSPLSSFVTPLVALLLPPFVIAARSPRGPALAGLGFWLVGAFAMIWLTAAPSETEGGLLPTFVVIVAPWCLGRLIRRRDLRVAELQAALASVEDERASRARLAVARERLRVARELHDAIGHSMTVIVLQAEAAQRMLERDPARAQEAKQAVRSVAAATLDQLRGTLGDDASPAEQLPSLLGLPRLVQRASSPDLQVELTVAGDRRELPAAVELAAYRVVQEALTNVARHAAPTSVEVLVEYRPTELRVAVIDAGPASPGPRAWPHGSGHGLRGMRERVAAHGGWLSAAPERGGFAVRSSLPITDVPA